MHANLSDAEVTSEPVPIIFLAPLAFVGADPFALAGSEIHTLVGVVLFA